MIVRAFRLLVLLCKWVAEWGLLVPMPLAAALRISPMLSVESRVSGGRARATQRVVADRVKQRILALVFKKHCMRAAPIQSLS